MAQTYWTIQLVGGAEKDFASWGVSLDFVVHRQNKNKSTLSLRTSEAFDPAAAQWNAYQRAIVWRDRSIDVNGTGSGGTVFFKGYFDDPRMEAGDGENIYYDLHNAWWLLEQNPFKQYRNEFTGFSAVLKKVLGVSIVVRGQNYQVGDILTISGGAGTSATYQVVAVDDAQGPGVGGVVLTWPANGNGSYGTVPATPNAVTGGHGSGCQLGLTFQPGPITKQVVLSEVFLGEDFHAPDGFTGAWPNGSGDQISEVIAWFASLDWAGQGMTVPLQLGTIDPHTMMPITRANTPFCNEAITMCLRWDPDAVIDIDDSQEPPAFNVRKLAKWNYATTPPTFIDYSNLTEAFIDITLQQEKRVMMQGQKSKQWSGIIIYYKTVDEIDNALYPHTQVDKFPTNITDQTPFVLTHTIELLGAKEQHEQATVRTNDAYPFTLLGGNSANQGTWWLGHDDTLTDKTVDQNSVAVIGAPTIKDDKGNALPAGYIYELIGTLPSWVGTAVRAHVSQQIAFTKYTNTSKVVKDVKPNQRLHTKTINVTNMPAGLYTTLSSIATAEPVPQNVAETCYRTMAASQWAGEITVLDTQLRSDVKIGMRLRLKGPHHTFGDVAALPPDNSAMIIQEITQRPDFGETVIKYGPGPSVDIDTWIEFARASRGRITWELPSGRGDGGTTAQGGVTDQTAHSQIDDTSHGVGGLGYHSVSAPAA